AVARRWSWQLFLPVKHDHVPNCSCYGHKCHSGNGHSACNVEQQEAPARDGRVEMHEEHNVSHGQQDANLGGTKDAVRKMEVPHRIGRKVALDGEHIEAHQHSGRYLPVHVAGGGESCHQRQRAEGVSHVVHVETVAWTLLIAD